MDADRIALAQTCLDAAHDGSLSFPAIIGKLLTAGFAGYAVDYRSGGQTYYLPDGESAAFALPPTPGFVAPDFDAQAIAALVRWAQADGPDYSYANFCTKAKAAGCAGYLVSFAGQRVVYYGRTAETHVEHFPQ
jgi:uncharacterized protein YbcV (DUF1398 family)